MGLVISAVCLQLVAIGFAGTYIWLNFFSAVKTEINERNRTLIGMLQKSMPLAIIFVLTSCFFVFNEDPVYVVDRASKICACFALSWILAVLGYVIGIIKLVATGTGFSKKIASTKVFFLLICAGIIGAAICAWLIS